MQPRQELDPLVTRKIDVARRPHVLPCRTVALERFVEVHVPQRRRPGLDQRVARGGVARGEEGHELLDAHRRPLAHVEREHLLDVVVHLVERAIHVELNAGGEHACAGGFADVHVRLPRLDLQRDDLGAEGPRADARDVAALELAVTRHAAVHHATVDRRDDLHPAGPVLGLEASTRARHDARRPCSRTAGSAASSPARPGRGSAVHARPPRPGCRARAGSRAAPPPRDARRRHRRCAASARASWGGSPGPRSAPAAHRGSSSRGCRRRGRRCPDSGRRPRPPILRRRACRDTRCPSRSEPRAAPPRRARIPRRST